jgi:hypothetical protein
MDKFHKVIAAAIAAGLIASTSLGIHAEASSSFSRTIDNDSIASGYGNFNRGFSYIKSSSLYNGDARISGSSVTSPRYEWDYPTITASGSSCKCTIQAYLNYASFTDTSARYTVEYASGYSTTVGYINQDKAPGGWSSISKTISPLSGLSYFSSSTAAVYNSSSSKQTGADGLKVSMVIQ